jgi:hypothetical protein
MGFTQKLWGDISLHEALNGQVGNGNFAREAHRGRDAHKEWLAG